MIISWTLYSFQNSQVKVGNFAVHISLLIDSDLEVLWHLAALMSHVLLC